MDKKNDSPRAPECQVQLPPTYGVLAPARTLGVDTYMWVDPSARQQSKGFLGQIAKMTNAGGGMNL